MARPLITFTSDFGHEDWFVGVVHGVLYGICPEAHVVDLCHTIEPGQVTKAAFILEAASGDFGPGAVHLAVVDPGVGTSRRALAVAAYGQYFVGPDNGILEWAFADPAAVVHALIEPRWFREPVSRTFHGRDVFAPVAGHLAKGVKLDAFGPPVIDPVRLGRRVALRDDGALVGRVAHVDRFGNALTNLLADALAEAFPGVRDSALVVEVGGLRIRGISRSYGDAPLGTVVAILGSSQRLEVAQVGGHAALRYGLGLGDPVVIRVAESTTPLAPA